MLRNDRLGLDGKGILDGIMTSRVPAILFIGCDTWVIPHVMVDVVGTQCHYGLEMGREMDRKRSSRLLDEKIMGRAAMVQKIDCHR